MARITVEDCLDNESNRFSLVRLASLRAKQLLTGATPVTDTKGNRSVVSALREIAAGKVRFRKIEEQQAIVVAEQFEALTSEQKEETSEETPPPVNH